MALASGCLDETRYHGPGESGEGVWAFAVDETTAPFLVVEDDAVYLVEERTTFEFREPTEDELLEMQELGDAQIPYATLPFLRRGDIEVQIDFTLSNLGEETADAAFLVNGINEFHEYQPEARIVDDELVVDFAGYERLFRIGPGERVSGTVREEQMDEIAADLATVVNGAPNANQIVYFQNQSSIDRRSQMYLPDVVPALTGVRLGLRTESNASPILAEVSIRVRDLRRVLVQGDDEPWALPAPQVVTPASLAPAPAM